MAEAPKHARDMTDAEFDAAVKALGKPVPRVSSAQSVRAPKPGTATGTTTSTGAAPKAAATGGFDARTASQEDAQAAARALGITTRIS